MEIQGMEVGKQPFDMQKTKSPDEIVLGYGHVGIYVSDLERSIRWYSDILGYKLLRKNEARLLEPDGSGDWFEATTAFLQCGDHNLELFYNPNWAPYDYRHYKGELGTKHISYRLPPEKYDRFVDYIWEKGVVLTVGGNKKHNVPTPHKEADTMMYFRDPDGIPIEMLRGNQDRSVKPKSK
jgi:catechol 2,3-dioxygenase-like lactoylglutathione lyase family enzyme